MNPNDISILDNPPASTSDIDIVGAYFQIGLDAIMENEVLLSAKQRMNLYTAVYNHICSLPRESEGFNLMGMALYDRLERHCSDRFTSLSEVCTDSLRAAIGIDVENRWRQ